ncbi:sodium:phosphate symporter [Rhizobium leguminosarum bv. trifolii CB782]|uniref:Na/Pi cotransporter family protein n=1 Tax=Rhizobium hidalgonense TaxID=1538159 RepID=A0A2A6KC38_9HYPH|nr:Na/Pi cotransporter family protein [Rhizobium hidalgonense]AHG46322.1 sodium:phosphate symporter [Rhizobium leguminosarum bv. trifolii CB782]EJC77248.1 phosphate:Na+ symporter family protein [Rhizobium leguminosarum bv. trifolii WSM2012]MDR9772287.1 Na/Pi cotransporter family protein [Rhizobium hidalgonense]MDR9804993.1 Na/Pi cotransporter family protein [Rhizobium hidalgonense]MDR9811526.1 Na/Pi cotransporter family protein [Rhizobium hidalgonense]
MDSTVIMINLFGAVALLLFGLAQVKDGVSRAFGARLRTGLATGTRGGFRSFLSGLVATIALQSSTATALMTASFVERDLIKPRMAQIVLLGANVGTAITAWIVATGIEWLSPLLILFGIVLYRGRSSARQGGGAALIGIGLMLLSLHLLGLATEPMRASPALAAFIGLLDGALPVALLFSAALAFLSSSSLAVVVLILSLASAGLVSAELVIVLVLGANLGGAIPPVIATLSGPVSARRVTLGNLAVRTLGCFIALPLAGYGAEFIRMLPFGPAKLPVDAHLAFNLLLAALAWPFSRPLATLMARLVPDQPEPDNAPKYLDAQELSTPVIALTSATREVLGVGDLIERMLVRVSEAFEQNDAGKLAEIPALEERVDRLQQAVKIYLSKLGREGLSDENARRSIVVIDYAINLEHMGDIIEKGLREEVAKKISLGLKFSDDGHQELRKLFDLTIDNLRVAQTIFVTRDFNLARQMMEIKVEVRRMEKQSAERHLERLRDGRADSLQTSSLHLDMLRDLKRINAHIVSVAHPIMDESGLLIESRVRTAVE